MTGLFLVGAIAQAQDAAPAPATLRLEVQLDPSIQEPIRGKLRSAISTELNAILIDTPEAGVSKLVVTLSGDGHVALTLHESVAPITRTLPWGPDAEVVARDIALMASNMVRDQTRDLLAEDAPPEPAPPSAPVATPPKPAPANAPATIDGEVPPDFVARPRPVPLPPNTPRIVLVAVGALPLALAANVDGKVVHDSGAGLGLQGRFDVPLAGALSLGGGVGIYLWDSPINGGPDTVNVQVTSVMDASLWFRVRQPLHGPISELYLTLGVGPSLQNHVTLMDEYSAVPPGIGLNAALLAGATVPVARGFGLVVEAGPQYHLMHVRVQPDASRLVVHALHFAAQIGVCWMFDAQ